MSKYDCSKCLDYSHEHQRMCEAKHTEIEGCGGCELYDGECFSPSSQEKIDIVQKWSDENPEPHEKTILEDFIEKYPNADINCKKMPLCCEAIYIGYTKCHECGQGCKKCWNRPLSEVMR